MTIESCKAEPVIRRVFDIEFDGVVVRRRGQDLEKKRYEELNYTIKLIPLPLGAMKRILHLENVPLAQILFQIRHREGLSRISVLASYGSKILPCHIQTVLSLPQLAR